MPGYDDVVARLAAEAGFADSVQRDPKGALAAYDLDARDLHRLAGLLSNHPASAAASTVANLFDPDADPAALDEP